MRVCVYWLIATRFVCLCTGQVRVVFNSVEFCLILSNRRWRALYYDLKQDRTHSCNESCVRQANTIFNPWRSMLKKLLFEWLWNKGRENRKISYLIEHLKMIYLVDIDRKLTYLRSFCVSRRSKALVGRRLKRIYFELRINWWKAVFLA